MAAVRTLVVLVALVGGSLEATAPQRPPSIPSGRNVAARVAAARRVTGVRGHVRLVREDASSGARTVRVLLVKARPYGPASTVLYQVQNPPSARRQALLLEYGPGRETSATWFDGPDTILPLGSPADLARPFFDTDAAVIDLSDDVFRWPNQEVTGTSNALRRRCVVLESRPGAAVRGPVAVVRSCVALELNLPLHMEWIGADGRPLRRMTVERVSRAEVGPWVATALTVESGDGSRRTRIEAIRGDRYASVPAAEFAIEAIRESLRERPAAKPPGGKAP